MHRLLTHKHIQLIFSVVIVAIAFFTKWYTLNYWAEQGITAIYPWFMPYLFIIWALVLMARLWYERSRLWSVWAMAVSLLWFGVESFAVVVGG